MRGSTSSTCCNNCKRLAHSSVAVLSSRFNARQFWGFKARFKTPWLCSAFTHRVPELVARLSTLGERRGCSSHSKAAIIAPT
mmetsp:Transcript_56087/g.156253  ORF Transcript_56087/g.156253 Transcript_56087/m.156253 type:complete len:82 (-) Transcript_56087:69-314(-)